jgi:hypothetical protein
LGIPQLYKSTKINKKELKKDFKLNDFELHKIIYTTFPSFNCTMPSFLRAAKYLMYSSTIMDDDEECTFKSRLSPEDRRRRDRRIPRRANLSYYEDSPFKNIFDSGEDQALPNLTGLDHHTFNKLIGILSTNRTTALSHGVVHSNR